MIRSNNLSVIWSVFNLDLSSNSSFKILYRIDTAWVTRQKAKICGLEGQVIFVIADKFIELVYGVKFPDSKKFRYGQELSKILGVEVLFESEAIEIYWNVLDYIKSAKNLKFKKADLIKEIDNRKQIYNSKKFKISEQRAKFWATRALGCFYSERVLENIIKKSTR